MFWQMLRTRHTYPTFLWDGSPIAGRPLRSGLDVETHRGGLCGVTTLSGVSNESYLSVILPRELDDLEGL